ncbi:MAG TPA: pitrilysin family protein [Candidatus Marinimicrobia bacterium]|nr:pitrilysin family protein [Candidatus Neomarinimicrobiota bacterium]HRS51548.1 pitrilysin family protein [Candidatus Neomarinimicrobiota bacterium]HRU92926.1 pitrilysin family protein [Candidatus Neomarinimicrobiota bacterium]
MISENIQRTILPSGIRVLSEYVDSVYSVSLGFWIQAGSQDEEDNENGIAHLLEHMVFKGTHKRTAFAIAHEIESLGGIINAFTSRNVTCFNVQLLHENLAKGVEVLADLILHSRFDSSELEKEKRVISEEIREIEDTPHDLIHDLFTQQLFPDQAIGRPIQGTIESVNAIQVSDLKHFLKRNYTTGRLAVSAAGRVNHDKLVKLVEKYCEEMENGNDYQGKETCNTQPETKRIYRKPIMQSHVILGRRIFGQGDSRRFQLGLLNMILSGGMTSRLFHNIREKYGYVYEVYSFSDLFLREGLFGVYAGVDKDRLDVVIDKIYNEMTALYRKPISVREFKKAKQQVKGGLVLAMESMNARMSNLAKMELYDKQIITIAELLEIVDKISIEDLQELACYLFDSNAFIETIIQPIES